MTVDALGDPIQLLIDTAEKQTWIVDEATYISLLTILDLLIQERGY